MGIRYAAALAQVLQTAQQQDISSLAVLKSYDRWRRYENWLVILMTDLLNRTFSNHWLPLVVLRRIVLHGTTARTPMRPILPATDGWTLGQTTPTIESNYRVLHY